MLDLHAGPNKDGKQYLPVYVQEEKTRLFIKAGELGIETTTGERWLDRTEIKDYATIARILGTVEGQAALARQAYFSLKKTDESHYSVSANFRLLGGGNSGSRAVHPVERELGVPSLVRLLGDTSMEVRKHAALKLRDLAAHAENRISIGREAEAISNLVRLLSDADVYVRWYAAGTLQNLGVDNDENRILIGRVPGAISSLVRSFGDADTDVRRSAAGALLNLAIHAENKIPIGREIGAILSLVRLLSDADVNVRWYAADALQYLGIADENQILIGKTPRAISKLVRLLSDADTKMRKSTAGALYNLAAHTENKIPIGREIGAISSLVRLLSDADIGVRRSAAGALKNIAIHAENRSSMGRETGAISSLVRLLSDADAYVRCYAAGALQCLGIADKNKILIGRSPGAISNLVRSLSDADTDVKRSAEGALNNLALNAENKKIIDAEKRKAGIEVVASPAPVAAAGAGAMAGAGSGAGAPVRSPVRVVTSGISVIPYRELTMGAALGRGAFGVVNKARWKSTEVAVKQLSLDSLAEDALKEFTREAENHAQLRHPNVVSLYGICTETGHYCLVMELMVRGSLFTVLHTTGESLSWTLRLSIANDIVAGLRYLHDAEMVHRDLKSLNVLLDDRMRAKLCDFGLAKVKHVSATATAGGPMGTIYWMAPELFRMGNHCSKATDMYALAIVLWEIASRRAPYETAPSQEVAVEWVKAGDREEVPTDAPPRYAQLIRQCWAQRPEERPSIKAAQEMLSAVKLSATYDSLAP